MNDERPTHLDLFSGIGGFALAARRAGFRTVGFCEIEPYAQRVLTKNFLAYTRCGGDEHRQRPSKASRASRPVEGEEDQRQRSGPDTRDRVPIISDIRTLNGNEFAGVTLLTGGFPCQPFSCAGKRRGTADDRHLWPEMLRVITEARPAWVLGENVTGIINMELDTVLSDLEGIGYACRPFVIPACGVDARHRRNRVWIVAHRDQQGSPQRSESQLLAKCAAAKRGRIALPTANRSRISPSRNNGGVGWQGKSVPIAGGDDNSLWLPEPDVGRVAHGIPARVDRLRGLGNAIVPEVAFQIIEAIAQIERGEIVV